MSRRCELTRLRWPVAVPPYKQIDVVVIHEAFAACVRDAWQYLLDKGKKIAQDAGIKPEDIVLGAIRSCRLGSESSLTRPSNARWDASRFLRQGFPTSTIRDESKHAKPQPVSPAANARVPSASRLRPPRSLALQPARFAVDRVPFHITLTVARTLLVVLSDVRDAGKRTSSA